MLTVNLDLSLIVDIYHSCFKSFLKADMDDKKHRLPADRQQRIIEVLKEKFSARSSHLSQLLGVSEMTIRRDLDILEQQGLLERTHGGAVFRKERVVGKFHYQSSAGINPAEKQKIARRAAAMIESNETVYIGEGVTASRIVRFVEPGMPFTVFTNNLGVVSETGENSAEIVLLAGTYQPATHAVAGPLTIEMIGQINTEKTFIGVDGLSLSAGLTTPNIEIAAAERCMIRSTRGEVVALADHSKFGLVAQMAVASLKQIDVLITNRAVPKDFQKELDRLDVRIIVA